MLEQQQAQLVAGLQELYRRTQSGEGWEGPPLKESSHGTPLTHDILERLGALKTGGQKSASERFEESPESLQQKLLANGAGLMQQAPSESGSESANSPTSDPANQKSSFTDPFSPGKLPPTPPSQSPFSQNSSPVFPMKNNISYYPSCLRRSAEDNLSQRQSWSSSGMGLDALLPQYDSPINMNSNPNAFDPSQMPVGTIAPYLSMRDWHHDVDFQRYFSAPTM